MTDSYCTFLNEASHQHLYDEILHMFTETQNCQRELYNLMFKKVGTRLNKQTSKITTIISTISRIREPIPIQQYDAVRKAGCLGSRFFV